MNEMLKNRPEPSSPGASREERIQIVRAACGVVAWLIEDHSVPLVSMDFCFRGGATQDGRAKAGMGAMLAGLLDEGAGDLDSLAFQTALEDNAVHLHYSCGRDHFSGHFQTLTRHGDAAFALLSASVLQARLDPSAVERVRSQLVASYKRNVSDPNFISARLFCESAYGDHPYSFPSQGDLQSLPNISRDDLIAQRTKLLARDNLLVAAVGAISASDLARRLDQIFAGLPERAALAPVADVVLQNIGATKIHEIDTPQSAVHFARAGLRRDDPDFMAGMVVNHVLGGGVFTARLFNEVREKRGLAYSIHSHLQNHDHVALLAGSTSTKNERTFESLDVIKEQMADLGAHGPSEDELDKAKKYLIGSYVLNFDTSTKISSQLLYVQQEGLAPSYFDARNRMVEAVSMEDARRAARRLCGDGQILAAIAGAPVGP